jgi:hypothetical protein
MQTNFKKIITGFLVPGKTAGKLEVYDTSSGAAVGPWDIAAGRIKQLGSLRCTTHPAVLQWDPGTLLQVE